MSLTKVLTTVCLFTALLMAPKPSVASLTCDGILGGKTSLLQDEAQLLQEMRKTGWMPLRGKGSAESWTVDGPEMAFYLREIRAVMLAAEPRVGTINTLLERRMENGQTTHVLDLFGSGFFIRPPEFDVMGIDVHSVTGMRYGPFDRTQLPANFPLNKMPTEVLGDIFEPQTWKGLDQSMRARNIPKMDLVAMRPVGAWDQSPFSETVEGNAAALTFILQNVIARLSPTGRFYFTLNLRPLNGVISETPEFQKLVQMIETKTPYRLVLLSRTSYDGNTVGLDGALVPK